MIGYYLSVLIFITNTVIYFCRVHVQWASKKVPPFNPYYVRLFKKTGGERGINGNGTGDERTTVLYVRIPVHFNFPVPVLSLQAHLHAYYTIYMYYTFTHVAE